MGRHPVSHQIKVWLAVTLLLASTPLFSILPYPVTAVVILCIANYLFQWQERYQQGSRWVKVLCLLIGGSSIYFWFDSPLELEVSASVLVLACAMKLLEIKGSRDIWVVMLCNFLVVVIGLLFSQSLLMAMYLLATLLVVISAMVGLHSLHDKNSLAKVLKTGIGIAVQSIPFMLILFFLVPRIPPLWSIPLPSRDATIGLTDSISPGDIARLSQSDELVFRATFTDKVPPQHELYWRAIVMSRFDGRTWSQESYNDLATRTNLLLDEIIRWYPSSSWFERNLLTTPIYRYDIIQEPSAKPWLFSLGPAYQSVSDSGITREHRLVARKPVALRRSYGQSYKAYKESSNNLPDWMAELNLNIPGQGDRRARILGQQLAEQYRGDPRKIAEDLLSRFRNEDFYYTLKPPLLGEDSIDDFLFNTRQGFCSHYAGAFVFVMRAAGIPARLIAGYQGGELKRQEQVIQVRQFDAHAWAEIWVSGKGWQRVDPTAAVSPERINEGLEEAVADEGTFLQENPLSPIHFRHIALFNGVRLAWEKLEYQWQRHVLGYQQERQEALFRKLFGDRDIYTVLTILLGITTVLFILIISLVLLRSKSQKRTYYDKLYNKFCSEMAKKGLIRGPAEGPLTYGQRISLVFPELKQEVLAFTLLYSSIAYGKKQSHDERRRMSIILDKIVRCKRF